MIDLQASTSTHSLDINKVGVKGVKYPVKIKLSDEITLASVATIDLYTSLAKDIRGTHMSRFIEVLQESERELSFYGVLNLLKSLQQRLDSENVFVLAKSDIFIAKSAPVSKVSGLLDYRIEFEAQLLKNICNTYLKLAIPVTTLCPCSKAISNYGAHNQRSIITVKFLLRNDLNLLALIKAIEDNASCELYSVLKRSDEKYVTEKAYDNPKFVEDIVRDVAKTLQQDFNITNCLVEAENFESIHNHSAYAVVDRLTTTSSMSQEFIKESVFDLS